MMRMIFSTVRAPQDPALTVESLAISATGLPSIVAVPVITPSAGSPSARTLAYRPSSVKLPSSVSSRIRSRAKSLPAFAADSWYFGAPPRSMPARTAARSECSATRGLYLGLTPGRSTEPFAHRVQPAGPGSRGLDPPGGSRRAVPGQQPGYLPGGVVFSHEGTLPSRSTATAARALCRNCTGSGAGAEHLGGQFTADDAFRLGRRVDHGGQVHAGGHPHVLDHVHEFLGGDVSGGPGRVRAAAEPAHRRIEVVHAQFQRREHVGQPGAAGVVEVQVQRRIRVPGAEPADQVAYPPGSRHPGGVAE